MEEKQENNLPKTPFDIMMERLGVKKSNSGGIEKLMKFNEAFRKRMAEIRAKKNKDI